MLAVADGGGDGGFAGEGGQASLPYDMTSVFGLKVGTVVLDADFC